MRASSTSAYFITNEINPQVTVTFSPQFGPDQETMQVVVLLFQGGPTGTLVGSSTQTLSNLEQNVAIMGAGLALNGFIGLKNNIIYFNGSYSTPGVSANMNGPVGGFFHENPGSETMTTPMKISAGEKSSVANLTWQAGLNGDSLEASYNFEGITGSIPLASSSGRVAVNQGDISINGEASFSQDCFQFTGSFIKAGVVQIGFSNAVFACMATSGS